MFIMFEQAWSGAFIESKRRQASVFDFLIKHELTKKKKKSLEL